MCFGRSNVFILSLNPKSMSVGFALLSDLPGHQQVLLWSLDENTARKY